MEISKPFITVILYIIGTLSLIIGILSLGNAISESRELAVVDAQMGAETMIGAFLFFALGYCCHKLRQIAEHLARK